MKRSLVAMGCLLGVAAVSSIAPHAEAGICANQAIFVFDQSGSMFVNGNDGRPKYQQAIEKAQADFDKLAVGTAVSIMGFGNSYTYSTDIDRIIVSLADGVTKTGNATTDKAFLDKLAVAAMPDNAYWTPLAGAWCDALEHVFYTNPDCAPDDPRHMYLYTDGLENRTPNESGNPSEPGFHQCRGTVENTGTFSYDLHDQGFGLTDNSWQWKVANMAWTGIPDLESLTGTFPMVLEINTFFTYISADSAVQVAEGATVTGVQDDINDAGIQFFTRLAGATLGTYYSAEKVVNYAGNTVASVVPVSGDTDPDHLRSCVEQADINRVRTVLNHYVREGNGAPGSSNTLGVAAEDMAKRDVNDDMYINLLDYRAVIKGYGKCIDRTRI